MDEIGADHLSELSSASHKRTNTNNSKFSNSITSAASASEENLVESSTTPKENVASNITYSIKNVDNRSSTVDNNFHLSLDKQQQNTAIRQKDSAIHLTDKIKNSSYNSSENDNSGRRRGTHMTSTYVPYTAVADIPGEITAPATEAAYQQKERQNKTATEDAAITTSDVECDCDSLLSDGKEKTDATPENMKKIDDVIELSNIRSTGVRHPDSINDIITVRPISKTRRPMVTSRRMNTFTGLTNDNISNSRSSSEMEPLAITEYIDDDAGDDDSSTTTTTTATAKQSLAFTIDNFSDKDCDPAAAAAKYKNMLERFQNRHRRGASMSKLEGALVADSQVPSPMSTPPVSARSNRGATPSNSINRKEESAATEVSAAATSKVKLRVRDRSTSRVRDSNKRHSWSPRSSTNETILAQHQQQQQQPQQQQKQKHRPYDNDSARSPPAFAKKPTLTTIRNKPPTLQMPKKSSKIPDVKQIFTPRSTAMQMAMQNIDFLCPQPPLADYKHLHLVGGEDNISEAGTYTLDGDNYTEEQKDLMNIDRNNAKLLLAQQNSSAQRPTDLAIPGSSSSASTQTPLSTTTISTSSSSHHPRSNHRQNVLEVNYYHESTPEAATPPIPQMRARNCDFSLNPQQSATSYLEKIKSRVLRNMSMAAGKCVDQDNDISSSPLISTMHTTTTTKNDSESNDSLKQMKVKIPLSQPSTPPDDIGTFTSVTTSGVLAKQCTLEAKPKFTRRSSLSTSQIDSSEYVSNEAKLKACGAVYSSGGFTDHQKAEYRLNLFTNQTDSQIFLNGGGGGGDGLNSGPDSPSVFSSKCPSEDVAKLSDTAVLKTAQTKNDWIQEWARNARARSVVASEEQKHKKNRHHDIMSRSYNCSDGSDLILTDDSLIYSQSHSYNRPPQPTASHHKTIVERFRLAGDFDYSSDPAISSAHTRKSTGDSVSSGSASRPPKSPSKIPSPLHSIGRARSASRTRASLQNILQDDEEPNQETDLYLQKTAAAISNLQNNLSRQNSVKSPSLASSRGGSPKKLQNNYHHHHQHHPRHQYYSADEYSPQHSVETANYTQQQQQPLQHWPPHKNVHKRNLSIESCRGMPRNNLMTNSYNEQQLMMMMADVKIPRPRKNSYDGQMQMLTTSPARRNNGSKTGSSTGNSRGGYYIDQTTESIKQMREVAEPLPKATAATAYHHHQQSLSPLRRSSSFSVKSVSGGNYAKAARPQYQNLYTPPAARHNYAAKQQSRAMSASASATTIKKSASSTNFRNVYSDYDDNIAYYINDEDDLIDEYYSSEEAEMEEDANGCSYEYEGDVGDYDYDDIEHTIEESPQPIFSNEVSTTTNNSSSADVPLSNTRYNKALLMRIERSKQKVAGGSSVTASVTTSKTAPCGVMACPNTPELPRRRNVKNPAISRAATAGTRQSVPRDSSLNRMSGQIPNSLASAKKQILQTAAAVSAPNTTSKRVQPKYLDISKYKPVQGNTFLRKNDAKSTLKPDPPMRRSPSSASMGLSRTDSTRVSNRSAKSATSAMTTSASSGTRGISAARRDSSVSKQKEVELAMWKRRATYDPMRAAAEDRRKKEEAKRLAQGGAAAVTESSSVARSQSFHCGVGSLNSNQSTAGSQEQSSENNQRWTLTSTESSDEEGEGGDAYVSSSTNRS